MAMLVFLNGEFVPEEKALVSISDRGFLYGDGLFETMRVFTSQPFRWESHLERLQRGAELLRIDLPFSPSAQRGFARELMERNAMFDCVLRVSLSRGIGQRGYSPRGADSPTFVMTLHPAPPFDLRKPLRWRMIQASCRLPAGNPLSAFKTANKLLQIVARAEADAAGVEEALLLNGRDEIVGATAANVFWIEEGGLFTPALVTGALPGVTRGVVFELCRSLGIPVREALAPPERLRSAEGVFLTNSIIGIMAMAELDCAPLRLSPMVEKLKAAHADLVQVECKHGMDSRLSP
jgi:branched-chain amino acid aminotransferase